jgi:hypothetical protein
MVQMQLGFEGVTFSTDCQLEHPLNPRTITVNVRIRFIIPTIKLTVIVLGLSGCSSWQSVENVTPSNPNCICTMEYDPVCIQGNGKILRYSNACQAMCDGFGQNDFINCPPY